MCKENLSSYEIIQALHSSILAWRIPWMEKPVQVAKSWTGLCNSLFFFLMQKGRNKEKDQRWDLSYLDNDS